jgi:spermidine synthase
MSGTEVSRLRALLAVLAAFALATPACSGRGRDNTPVETATVATDPGPTTPSPAETATGAALPDAADPTRESFVSPTIRPRGTGKVFEEQSPFGRVTVLDKPDRRCLLFEDGGEQTCMDLARPSRVVHEYMRFMAVGVLFVKPAPRTLMIGLGGGAAIRMLMPRDPGMRMDIVDINPTVVKVAKEYFGVPDSPRLAIHVADGRKFVDESAERWDLVMLDAYGAEAVPFPLATVEYARSIAAHMSPGGAVVSNIWYRNDKLFRALLRTWREAFPAMYVFKGIESVNGIVVGSLESPAPSCAELTARAKERAPGYDFPFELSTPTARCTTLDAYKLDDVPIISDSKPDEFKKLGAM